jgi:hypothetical protein
MTTLLADNVYLYLGVPLRSGTAAVAVWQRATACSAGAMTWSSSASMNAGVKTLVLSHLIPADDPTVTDEMWINAARVHFHGRVMVGRDLLEV